MTPTQIKKAKEAYGAGLFDTPNAKKFVDDNINRKVKEDSFFEFVQKLNGKAYEKR